jgi:hypothetical protein
VSPGPLSLVFPLFEAIEASALAATIRESTWLTGLLSSVHLVGLALTLGGALFSALTLLGAIGPSEHRTDVIRPTSRAITIGLVISLVTGFLLFAPRAVSAAGNSTFQLKMSLLALAALLHLTLGRAGSGQSASLGLPRAVRGIGLVLWIGVALAGCAYILLE